MNTKGDIEKGFDRIASLYSILSGIVFGNTLVNSQTWFCTEIKPGDRVLIAGIGDGKILEKLLQLKLASGIVCVDISRKMLDKARQLVLMRFPEMISRIHFIHQPIQLFQAKGRFDVICFPYLLDCLEQKDIISVVHNTKNMLNRGGIVILTEFRIPETGPRKIYGKLLLKTLYAFFRAVCRIKVTVLPNFDPLFSSEGFRKVREKRFYGEILFSRVYSLQ